jgi:hypothetical protein
MPQADACAVTRRQVRVCTRMCSLSVAGLRVLRPQYVIISSTFIYFVMNVTVKLTCGSDVLGATLQHKGGARAARVVRAQRRRHCTAATVTGCRE